jgi:hypothetical protein
MEFCLSKQVKLDLLSLDKDPNHSQQTENRVSTRKVMVQF